MTSRRRLSLDDYGKNGNSVSSSSFFSGGGTTGTTTTGGPAGGRRSSLSGAVRRSSRNLQHDLNIRVLNRHPQHEAPINSKERQQRRSRRQSEYKQIQESRNGRMESITGQWQSHRSSFVSEEKEMERLLKENPSSGWCCGLTLCCGW